MKALDSCAAAGTVIGAGMALLEARDRLFARHPRTPWVALRRDPA